MVRWNLERLALALQPLGAPLDGALDGFQASFFEGLRSGILRRLGLDSAGDAADAALVQTWLTFAERSRAPLDQLYFDWYGGLASEARAARSPSAALYRADFDALRAILASFSPAHPSRLADPCLTRERPVNLHIDTVEAIWDAIARDDDWAPLTRQIAEIRALGQLLGPS